jgi:hypothetical protein
MNNKEYTRERKKRMLKQQIVKAPENTNNIEGENRGIKRPKVKRVSMLTLTIVFIVGSFGLVWYLYTRNYIYTRHTEISSIEFPEGNVPKFIRYADNIIRYTRDGISYINAKGVVVWTIPYEMKNPVVVISGSYAAVSDIRGTKVIICDTKGEVGSFTTGLPIVKCDISSIGISTVVLEDAKANYLQYYNKDGSRIDIEIEWLISKNGYPLDISLSPNASLLAVSLMYMDAGVLQNHVVFYNFSKKGQNIPDGLSGGFKMNGDAIVPRVHFFDDENAVAFADNAVLLYSAQNEIKVENTKTIELEGEVKSIFYDERKFGIVSGNTNGSERYIMKLYNKNGTKINDISFDFEYSNIEIGEKYIMMFGNNKFMIYNMYGVCKYSGEMDFEIMNIDETSIINRFLITGSKGMYEIELK